MYMVGVGVGVGPNKKPDTFATILCYRHSVWSGYLSSVNQGYFLMINHQTWKNQILKIDKRGRESILGPGQ